MIVPNNGYAEVVELGCDAESVKLIGEILHNDVFFVCPFAFQTMSFDSRSVTLWRSHT